jgi:hypothetical protein
MRSLMKTEGRLSAFGARNMGIIRRIVRIHQSATSAKRKVTWRLNAMIFTPRVET